MTLQGDHHHYLSLCIMYARQVIWNFLEQICKQPTIYKWEGCSGDVSLHGSYASTGLAGHANTAAG